MRPHGLDSSAVNLTNRPSSKKAPPQNLWVGSHTWGLVEVDLVQEVGEHDDKLLALAIVSNAILAMGMRDKLLEMKWYLRKNGKDAKTSLAKRENRYPHEGRVTPKKLRSHQYSKTHRAYRLCRFHC